MISMYDIEYVHELSFVLMYPLDHDIVHGVGAYLDPLRLLDVLLQLCLVLVLDRDELGHEALIARTRNDLLDHPHVRDPVVVVADGL